MKLTVIGGGGVRAIQLARSLAQAAPKLGIRRIVFMDSDPEKLAIFGRMSREAARRLAPELDFQITTDAEQAVRDADYIITTIRAGGDDMRVRDERAALDLGLLGQETTGAAGFSFAMRSVPALAAYCALAKRLAKPDVKVFNFTNPAGVVSQTLRDMGYDFTFGICDTPGSLLASVAKLKGVSPDRVTGSCYGLNHLSFFDSVKLDGRELLPGLLADERLYAQTDMGFFQRDLAQHMGCLLNEYLYYFFYREQAVAHILAAQQTRGELIAGLNRGMIAELSGMDVEREFDACLKVYEKWYGRREGAYMANETGKRRDRGAWRFDLWAEDDGGYAGVALKYIRARVTGERLSMTLCVPNGGAIPGLADSDVVEVTCDLENGAFTPRRVEKPGELQMELIRRVKLYERYASEALRTKSVSKAVDCLMVHPLVNSWSLAKKLAEIYIEANRAFSGGWH